MNTLAHHHPAIATKPQPALHTLVWHRTEEDRVALRPLLYLRFVNIAMLAFGVLFATAVKPLAEFGGWLVFMGLILFAWGGFIQGAEEIAMRDRH